MLEHIIHIEIDNFPYDIDHNHYLFIETKYSKSRNEALDELLSKVFDATSENHKTRDINTPYSILYLLEQIDFLPLGIRHIINEEPSVFYKDSMPFLEDLYSNVLGEKNIRNLNNSCGFIHFSGFGEGNAMVFTFFPLPDSFFKNIDERKLATEILLLPRIEDNTIRLHDRGDDIPIHYRKDVRIENAPLGALHVNPNISNNYRKKILNFTIQDFIKRYVLLNDLIRQQRGLIPVMHISLKGSNRAKKAHWELLWKDGNNKTIASATIHPRDLAFYLTILGKLKGFKTGDLIVNTSANQYSYTQPAQNLLDYYYVLVNNPNGNLVNSTQNLSCPYREPRRIISKINSDIKKALREAYENHFLNATDYNCLESIYSINMDPYHHYFVLSLYNYYIYIDRSIKSKIKYI